MADTIQLSIGGMACASCAARVEKKLNRMEGVTATVNYATQKARVTFPDAVSPDDRVATVKATGYTAALPPPPVSTDHSWRLSPKPPEEGSAADAEVATSASAIALDPTVLLRRRVLVSLAAPECLECRCPSP